jgi:hypothetical protein
MPEKAAGLTVKRGGPRSLLHAEQPIAVAATRADRAADGSPAHREQRPVEAHAAARAGAAAMGAGRSGLQAAMLNRARNGTPGNARSQASMAALSVKRQAG